MADETTPDAVEMLQRMHACVVLSENHGDVPRIGSDEVLAVLRATQDERARHAEEVARLEEQFAGSCEAEELRSGLEKLMADRGPRGTDAVSRDSLQALLDKVDARDSLLTLETIDSLRDQLRKVEGERAMWEKTASVLSGKLDSLRSLLPDVRACAEHCISCSRSGEATTEAARNILAALDSHECPECHRNSDHKMSCSRGGSKGGRFSVSLDSRKDGGQ